MLNFNRNRECNVRITAGEQVFCCSVIKFNQGLVDLKLWEDMQFFRNFSAVECNT